MIELLSASSSSSSLDLIYFRKISCSTNHKNNMRAEAIRKNNSKKQKDKNIFLLDENADGK
jgi:hypothetical protein